MKRSAPTPTIRPAQIWAYALDRYDPRELRIVSVAADTVRVVFFDPRNDLHSTKTVPRRHFGPYRCERTGHNRRARYRLLREAPAEKRTA